MFRSERLVVALAILLGASGSAFAAPPSRQPAPQPPSSEPENVQRARAEFVAATEHVRNSRWGEALAAFERSYELRPHALTTFNIGACERALGRYTRARATLLRALEANEANRGELAPSFVADARKWIDEINGILVRASVSLKPADATLLVDGAPLTGGASHGDYLAGMAPSGQQGPNLSERFSLTLDPGIHVFSLSRAGFANAVTTKTVTPGTKPEITLDMESLPATIRIAANRPSSVVTLDDLDVGMAPVQLTRPAGVYRVTVRRPGFVPYETKVKVGPGEAPSIQATLVEEKTPITKKFWFWGTAVAVVAGAALGTYFLTRPEPERPAPNGGGLGWVVTLPSSR